MELAILFRPTSTKGQPAASSALSTGGAHIFFAPSAAKGLDASLRRLAAAHAPILIIGETGTGKETAARHVHASGDRRHGPFVAVNCRALSDMAADADLLGYEKGAFPGALTAQRGWFEAANGGTLFLDEVGALPYSAQLKLLRSLQQRDVTRMGSIVPIPVDVRVIASSTPGLRKAIDENLFNEELYFELNVFNLMIPPLRSRVEEIPALAYHFLRLHADFLAKPVSEISASAFDILRRYAWPGNIKEFENTIQNAVLLASGDVIGPEDLRIVEQSHPAGDRTFEDSLLALLREAYSRAEPDVFNRATRSMVTSAFAFAGQNQVRTADILGVSRNTLRTQLANLGSITRRRKDSIPSTKRELKIGYQRFGTLSVLKALGSLDETLAEKGYSIRWTSYAAGPSLLAALHAGEIDFGATGDVPPIFAQAVGAPLVYVAHEPAAPESVALVVPQDSTIRTLSDLRGKRIKFSRGSNVHYLVVKALEASGLSFDDIECVYAEPSDSAGYVEGGDADVWALWDPLLQMAQQARKLRVLTDGSGLVQNHQFYLASKRFIATMEELLSVLLQELQAAGLFVANQPVEAACLLSEKIGTDASALTVAFNRLTHGARLLSKQVIGEQQKIADHFHSLGLLPKSISVHEAVFSAGAQARRTTLSL